MTMRILVVDDEPDAAMLFRQQFRREIRQGECRLDFASSAQEAIEALSVEHPSPNMLILSDINMPGRSGLELLAEIRQRWPALAVFMITAYSDIDTEKHAYELGATAFLHKPVDFTDLKQKLRQLSGGGSA